MNVLILNPKAVLIEADHATGEVSTADFESVGKANIAQPHIINGKNGLTIGKQHNEYGGLQTIALIPINLQKTVYHKTTYESFPTQAIDEE